MAATARLSRRTEPEPADPGLEETLSSLRSTGRPVHQLLRRQWSPEQIAGRLRLEGTLRISHETIYTHIWRDKAAGGDLWLQLRGAAKLRRKRRNSYDSRGRLAGKRHISERPSIVDCRTRIGDWEVDTVVGAGSKDCVATLVERKSGFTLLGKTS